MPLRFIRSKVSVMDPLQVAISTTALAKDLLSTLQFPPAIAAVSVVLLILETVQDIQTNKACCVALAQRAAEILVNIDLQMRGRWDSAPERLVQNLQKFEGTLQLIYEFMKRLAELKWSDRFLRKNSIEDALARYTRLLDEAAQSFQLATLIDLHYTIGTLSQENAENVGVQAEAQLCIEAPPPYKKKIDSSIQETGIVESCTTEPKQVGSSLELSLSLPSEESITEITTDGIRDCLNDHYLPEQLSSLTLDNSHGFRRYHQSEVILWGQSHLKEGWWAGGMEVQVNGQAALIKRYDDAKVIAYRRWLRDVKMLQNLYHPNLPQMLGFSDEDSPTPFILLSNVKIETPEAIIWDMLQSANIATCVGLMLRFYQDLADTAMYVQRQLNLTDSQVQDFFEAARFCVDSHKTLVVGLPPPQEGKWYCARNYGLAHTLLNICLKMLPNQGKVIHSYTECDEEITEDMQKKINHLVTLAQSLLPSGSQQPSLPSKLQKLIKHNNFETSSLTLHQVRDLMFHAGAHEHSWYEWNVPACKFSVGDLGYVPQGKDWNSFVHLGNVIEDDPGTLKLSFRARGEYWCWKNLPIKRQPLQAFELPINIYGWPVAVPPHKQIDVVVVHEAFATCVRDAWQYLLRYGKKIAQEAGIKPEHIVLVTHAGTHQDFYVKDFQPQPFGMGQDKKNMQHAAGPFNQQPSIFVFPGHPHTNQLTLPSIVYLFTSLSQSHEPYWSSSPICAMPGSHHPPLDQHLTYKIGYKTGFLNYVQLHGEDFEGQ